MATAKIYHTLLSDYSITMSETEDSSFPLSNLKTYFEDDLWKSSNNSNGQALTIDFGAAKACDSLVLAEENIRDMSGGGDVVLQADTSAGFGSPTTVLANLVGGEDVDDGTRRVFEFSSLSRRYWRILFINTDATIPQIGQIYLDTRLDFENAYDWPYRKGSPQFETFVSPAVDGRIRTSQQYAGRLSQSFTFSLQNNTVRTNYLAFVERVRGRLRPFYFRDHEDGFGFFVSDQDLLPVDTTRYAQNKMTIAMTEQRATRGE